MTDETKDRDDRVVEFRPRSPEEAGEKKERKRRPSRRSWLEKSSGVYSAGQMLLCQIASPEGGGYSVLILPDNVQAYLISNRRHKPGEQVWTQFLCVSDDRLMVNVLDRNPAVPLHDFSRQFKTGQIVNCKILQGRPGGYDVIVGDNDLPAVLKSNRRLDVGTEVSARVEMVDEDLIVLNEVFRAKSD
ncbi:MAG: hypothetical protein IPM23_07570 [Candidatus Melainabacteria bacterium]|nr:hypothetical protein [Candidatus Melainabacteria bacterium]